MATTYRVTNLTSSETELLNSGQLQTRFAPELGGDSTDASTERREWLKVFLATPILQKSQGVSVEELDSATVFSDLLAQYDKERKELVATKTKLDGALIDVLHALTEDEVAEGEVHKTTEKGKVSVSVVELWLSKGKPNLDDLIEKQQTRLPKHVVKDLRRIQTKRKAAAANRVSK